MDNLGARAIGTDASIGISKAKELSNFDVAKADEYNSYWENINQKKDELTRQAAGFTLSRIPTYTEADTHPLAGTQAESEQKFDEYTKLLAKDLYVHWLTERMPYSDLDGNTSVWLMKKAGLPIDNVRKDVTYGPKGSFQPGKVNLGTGNRDGITSNFRKKVLTRELTPKEEQNEFIVKYEDLQPEEQKLYLEKVKDDSDTLGQKAFAETYESTGFIDHHGENSGPDTSAAKFTYEMLVSSGLLRRSVALEKMVALVTQLDNQTFTKAEDHFEESYDMMLGLAEQTSPDSLYKFFLDKKNPLDKLTDEDKSQYGIVFTERRGKKRDKSNERKELISKFLSHIDKISDQGFVVETPTFGKTFIDIVDGTAVERVANGPKMLSQAALARGYQSYLLWSRETNSIWLAASENIPEDFSLPQGENRRKRLWHKPQASSEEDPLTMTLDQVLEKMNVDLNSLPADSGLKKYLENGKLPEVDLSDLPEIKEDINGTDAQKENGSSEKKPENEKLSQEFIRENIEKSFDEGGEWVLGEGNTETITLSADECGKNGAIGGTLPGEIKLIPGHTYKVVKRFGKGGMYPYEVGVADESATDDKVYILTAGVLYNNLRPKWIVDYSEKKRGFLKAQYRVWIDRKFAKPRQEKIVVPPESDLLEEKIETVESQIETPLEESNDIPVESIENNELNKAETVVAKTEEELIGSEDPINDDTDSGSEQQKIKEKGQKKFDRRKLDRKNEQEIDMEEPVIRKAVPATEDESENVQEVQQYDFDFDGTTFTLRKGDTLTLEVGPGVDLTYSIVSIKKMPNNLIEIVTDKDSETYTVERWITALKIFKEVKETINEEE